MGDPGSETGRYAGALSGAYLGYRHGGLYGAAIGAGVGSFAGGGGFARFDAARGGRGQLRRCGVQRRAGPDRADLKGFATRVANNEQRASDARVSARAEAAGR